MYPTCGCWSFPFARRLLPILPPSMGKQPSPYSRAGSGDDSRSKATSSYAPRSKRDNFGCLTCRVRRKKCKEPTGDDTKPCESCQRNGVECLGYPGLSPSWASRNQVLIATSSKSPLFTDSNARTGFASVPSEANCGSSCLKVPTERLAQFSTCPFTRNRMYP